MTGLRAIPAVPLALGLAGLVPFWALAIMLVARGGMALDPDFVARALATYAAVILSFLGGIRWGLAARGGERTTSNYTVSVIPSLIGWALLAAPDPWRLAGLGAVVLVLGPIDAQMVQQGLAPLWLGRLRLILSTGAGVALFLGAIGSGRV